MNNLQPFDWVLTLGIIGTITGIIEMNEVFRFLILLATFIGIVIKTYEQLHKSEFFLKDIKTLWNRIRKK